MYCTDCGTRNPNDSKYCRECGKKIFVLEEQSRLLPNRPSKSLNIEFIEPPQEPEKLRLLLDMAFWHNEVGNIPGAITACEAALKVDPTSTSALSLLGCLHEKQGNDEKAIEAFGRVVELNPDSAADVEKLELLLQGIRTKAVTPSLVHQITPPVLLETARRYPSLPGIAAIAVGVLLFVAVSTAVWGRFQSPSAPKQVAAGTGSAISSVNPAPGSAGATVAPVKMLQQTPGLPAPSPGVSPDPFLAQYPHAIQVASSAASERSAQQKEMPAPPSVPSVSNIKPLTIPASAVPNHVVAVEPLQPTNDHVVMVAPNVAPQQTADNRVDSDGNAASSDAPAPPASHIYIKVHNDDDTTPSPQNAAILVPTDDNIHAISLRENAGASLQQKGLNLQESGDYKAAAAAYASAIAAYQEDVANGRSTDSAKRGIDACQVAIEICKQSQ